MDIREIRFGIEIETIKRTREETAAAIHSVVGGTIRHVGYPASYDPWEIEDLRGRKWKVVADASLTSVPAHLRAEIVSPVLTYDSTRYVTLNQPPRGVCSASANRVLVKTKTSLGNAKVISIAREVAWIF